MPAGGEIFQTSMYSANGITPWHKIGEVGREGEAETASQVAARIAIPTAKLAELKFTWNGKVVRPGYSQVVIPSLSDDTPIPVGGPVQSGAYHLITHQDAIRLWDEEVRDGDGNPVPVETLGVLGQYGDRLFITCKLPSYSVKGDPMDSYLFLFNTVRPGVAMRAIETDVRVVCANTVQSAFGRAIQQFHIPHTSGAEKRLRKHLRDIYSVKLEAQALIKEAYELMAETRVTEAQVADVAARVYREPRKPDPARLTKADWSERVRGYEARIQWVQETRAAVVDAFTGGGIGLGYGSLAGTAWHGFNAFTENETHRKGRALVVARELLEGDRSKYIRRAHMHMMAYCQPEKATQYEVAAEAL